MKYLLAIYIATTLNVRMAIMAVLMALLTACIDENNIRMYSHSMTYNQSEKIEKIEGSGKRVFIMIDGASEKAIQLIDFENDGKIDIVNILDTANKKFTSIFEQDNETIVFIADMTNDDCKLWTARLLMGNATYDCHRGNGLEWVFQDKAGQVHYVHLRLIANGPGVDSTPH